MRYIILSFILALSVVVFNALADEKQQVNESGKKQFLLPSTLSPTTAVTTPAARQHPTSPRVLGVP